jgi:hypothetical protein
MTKPMPTLEDDIFVNQWVQGVQSTPDVLHWFESSPTERQLEILRRLVALCKQARASGRDGVDAISSSALNPRRSACVLLSKGASVEILNKLSALKRADGVDALVLLLHLLKFADERRRAGEISGSCSHWWHRDLGDPKVLDEIRKAYSQGSL